MLFVPDDRSGNMKILNDDTHTHTQTRSKLKWHTVAIVFPATSRYSFRFRFCISHGKKIQKAKFVWINYPTEQWIPETNDSEYHYDYNIIITYLTHAKFKNYRNRTRIERNVTRDPDGNALAFRTIKF